MQFPFIDQQLCAGFSAKGINNARKLIRYDYKRLSGVIAEIIPTVKLQDALLKHCRDLPQLNWKHSLQQSEILVDVTIKCTPRVMSKLSKDKATWYVVVAALNGNVIALKRHATSSLNFSIKVALSPSDAPSKLHLVSDCIFGLDQIVDLQKSG